MTNDNLPPGTTAADIDRHFGAPDKVRIIGSVILDVDAQVPVEASEEEQKEALRAAFEAGDGSIAHIEIVEEEPI